MKFTQRRIISAVLTSVSLLNTVCSTSIDVTDITTPIDTTSTTQQTVWYGDKQITYYTQGPAAGQILIFLHGWPAIAETWRAQIDYFSNLGYFVVAPDMPGYGRSTARNVTSDYALENIVTGLLAMLADAGRESAVWIGHDWGAGVGSTLVAVHPDVVDAMAWLAVPYKTLELGYEYMLQFVNRTVYLDPEFHYAQWDYQTYYHTNLARASGVFETDYEYSTKAIFGKSSGNASVLGTRAATSYVTADNGRFCGVDSLPPPANVTCSPGEARPPQNIPLNATVLNENLFDSVVTALKNTTFASGSGYYLNQESNKDYILQNQKNDGVLSIPCLFIQADYDRVLDTIDSTLLSPMPAHCENFSFAHLPTGHWVQMEAPDDTNAAIANWLATSVMSS